MLRAIIIDDEYRGVNALRTLIEEYIEDLKVVGHTTLAGEGINLIENYKPEIVFLDINMPEMTGFELLEKVNWKNFSLIFTTAHKEYALKALKNNAVDYLLKPVDHEELSAAINKIKARTQDLDRGTSANYIKLLNELNQFNNKNKILVSLKADIEAIDICKIIYLESHSNYTKIHLTNRRVISTSKNLKYFEDQLCVVGLNFMRVHHSYVINLNKVVRYLKSTEQIVLEDSREIPLSKSKREVFYSWLSV